MAAFSKSTSAHSPIFFLLTDKNKTKNSHRYQQLPLIALEEFLSQSPDLASADEKTLMFARINHELSEREALEQARQGLLKKKQSLIADNKKRKEDLASLDKDLETFIDVSFFSLLSLGFFFRPG